MDAIKGKLAADKKDEEGDDSVDDFLAEWHLTVSTLHFGQHRKEGADEVQDSKASRHDDEDDERSSKISLQAICPVLLLKRKESLQNPNCLISNTVERMPEPNSFVRFFLHGRADCRLILSTRGILLQKLQMISMMMVQ